MSKLRRVSVFGCLLKNGSSVPSQYGQTCFLLPSYKMHTTEQRSGFCQLRLVCCPDSPFHYQSFYLYLLLLTSLLLGELTVHLLYLEKKWTARFMQARANAGRCKARRKLLDIIQRNLLWEFSFHNVGISLSPTYWPGVRRESYCNLNSI